MQLHFFSCEENLKLNKQEEFDALESVKAAVCNFQIQYSITTYSHYFVHYIAMTYY